MKFSVGYQLPDDNFSFAELARDYLENMAEVFFPWINFATGRASVHERHGTVDWHAQKDIESDLAEIKKLGIKLDLLINGNCFGAHAMSVYLENRIKSTVEYLNEITGGLDIITTASPAAAFIIKKHFPGIEVRASVNMRIGTVKGMQYMENLFDSFHMQREYNRDLKHISELKSWTDAHGKKLIMLANSGCMNFCSGQTFHDNCVAHEKEIDEIKNMPDFKMHACWNYLSDRSHFVSVLQNSWVRPEDLGHYDEYFPVVKLATRMHSNPRLVLQAYANRRYHGNLLDLLEPGFSPAFAPWVIDNDRFPADWFARSASCNKNCHNCPYCDQVLKTVIYQPGN